jgi:outer membrane protease
MKNKICLLILTVCCSLLADAQTNDTSTNSSKFYFGGHIFVRTEKYNSIYEVSPSVGYYVTDQFLVASSFYFSKYKLIQYIDDKKSTSNYNYYGPSIFLRYYLAKEKFFSNLFLHSEYMMLKSDYSFLNSAQKTEKGNYNANIFQTGIGYRQIIANRFFLNFLVLVEPSPHKNTPYKNPTLRIGVEF